MKIKCPLCKFNFVLQGSSDKVTCPECYHVFSPGGRPADEPTAAFPGLSAEGKKSSDEETSGFRKMPDSETGSYGKVEDPEDVSKAGSNAERDLGFVDLISDSQETPIPDKKEEEIIHPEPPKIKKASIQFEDVQEETKDQHSHIEEPEKKDSGKDLDFEMPSEWQKELKKDSAEPSEETPPSPPPHSGIQEPSAKGHQPASVIVDKPSYTKKARGEKMSIAPIIAIILFIILIAGGGYVVYVYKIQGGKVLQEAEAAKNAGDINKAIVLYQELKDKYFRKSLADQELSKLLEVRKNFTQKCQQADNKYRKALALRKQKLYDEALNLLESIPKDYPGTPAASEALKLVPDITAEAKAKKILSENITSIMNDVSSLAKDKKFDLAIAKAKEAQSLDKDNFEIQKRIMDIEILKKEYENTILAKEKYESLLKGAKENMAADKWWDAIKLLEDAQKIEKTDAAKNLLNKAYYELYIEKGDELCKKNNWSDASISYKKALSYKDEKDGREKFALAQGKLKEGEQENLRRQKVSELLDKAKQLETVDELAAAIETYRNALEYATDEKDDIKKSLSNCQQRIEDLYSMYMQKGKSNLNEEEWNLALADFNMALRYKPEDKEALNLKSLAAKNNPCPDNMVYIKGGESIYGNSKVTIKGFCIDTYEFPNKAGEFPMTRVTWLEAAKECELRGKRLCTEMEWERACRGKSGNLYPYGSSYVPKRCATELEWEKGPVKCGSYPLCKTDEGVYDLSGNVSEWVDAWYTDARDKRVLRGGAWGNTGDVCTCIYRLAQDPSKKLATSGFRCSKDPKSK